MAEQRPLDLYRSPNLPACFQCAYEQDQTRRWDNYKRVAADGHQLVESPRFILKATHSLHN